MGEPHARYMLHSSHDYYKEPFAEVDGAQQQFNSLEICPPELCTRLGWLLCGAEKLARRDGAQLAHVLEVLLHLHFGSKPLF